MCEHDIYALPMIEFVGGSTQEFRFHAYLHKGARKMSLTGCTTTFSVLSYVNKTGDPIISKAMDIRADDDGVENILHVELTSEESVELHGKYIYQITITDPSGDTDVPKQGILRIINNIDKKLVL